MKLQKLNILEFLYKDTNNSCFDIRISLYPDIKKGYFNFTLYETENHTFSYEKKIFDSQILWEGLEYDNYFSELTTYSNALLKRILKNTAFL